MEETRTKEPPITIYRHDINDDISEQSSLFSYFLLLLIVAAIFYLVFHNKQKVGSITKFINSIGSKINFPILFFRYWLYFWKAGGKNQDEGVQRQALNIENWITI